MAVDKSTGSNPPAETLKALQQEIQAILKDWIALLKVKAADPNSLETVDQLLMRQTDLSGLPTALGEIRDRGRVAIGNLHRSRKESFGLFEVAFLKRMKERGIPEREAGGGWRVGPIELELRREQGQARAKYNHEQVVPWRRIASAEDLEGLWDAANSYLEKAAISDGDLVDVVRGAYQDALQRRQRKDGTVAVHDLMRSLRVELVRHELGTGKPDKKLQRADCSLPVMLYHLDRFRRAQAAARAGVQLMFQTGSQAEQQKGLGVVLNGLDPTQDYKVFCYIRATGDPAAA